MDRIFLGLIFLVFILSTTGCLNLDNSDDNEKWVPGILIIDFDNSVNDTIAREIIVSYNLTMVEFFDLQASVEVPIGDEQEYINILMEEPKIIGVGRLPEQPE